MSSRDSMTDVGRRLLAGVLLGAVLAAGWSACERDDAEAHWDVCDGVSCSHHGLCVIVSDEPGCLCDPGFDVDGLECVTSDAAPVIESTPPTDATELEEYSYEALCTDPDGDAVSLGVGPDDTCGGAVQDHGDGSATYTFTPAAGQGGTTCDVAVSCSDDVLDATQVETITVAD